MPARTDDKLFISKGIQTIQNEPETTLHLNHQGQLTTSLMENRQTFRPYHTLEEKMADTDGIERPERIIHQQIAPKKSTFKKKPLECRVCKSRKRIYARMVCNRCYYRDSKVERKAWACEHGAAGTPHYSKGLC